MTSNINSIESKIENMVQSLQQLDKSLSINDEKT